MSKIELLTLLTGFAKEYVPDAIASVSRNSHMNNLMNAEESVTRTVAEAVIVDFINFVGFRQGVDYGLYTSDLNLIESPKA